MKWFKKLCRAKFANHSKPIADRNDDSGKRREPNKDSASKVSKSESNRLKTVSLPSYKHGLASASATATAAIGYDSTTAMVRPNAVHSSRRAFLDKQRRIYDNCTDDIEQYNDGSSSFLNPDGDGGKRSDLEPPKAKLFVISDEYYCGSSSDYATDTESDGDVASDIDYERSQTDTDHSALRKQARDLEHFISDPEETTRWPRRNADGRKKKRVRRGFFNIPGEFRTCSYKTEEESRSDWVVVTVELERTYSCDSTLNEHFCQLIENSARDNSSSSGASADPQTNSSDPKATLPGIDEDYGLFYARNRHLRRLLRVFRFFDFDIKFGKPLPDQLKRHLAKCAEPTESPLLQRIREKNEEIDRHERLLRYQRNSYFLSQEDPCCSRTMDMEMDKMTTLLFQGSTPDTDCKSSNQSKNESDTFCVAKYFGLNDDGDIVIHFDHIVEQKGYGFLMRRKRRTYRRVGFAQEISESERVPVIANSFLTNLLESLCKLCKCHAKRPESKVINYLVSLDCVRCVVVVSFCRYEKFLQN